MNSSRRAPYSQNPRRKSPLPRIFFSPWSAIHPPSKKFSGALRVRCPLSSAAPSTPTPVPFLPPSRARLPLPAPNAAPVTGGDWGAKKGELVFMIGGDAATLKEAEPIFSVMGKKLFHLGPNGAGQTIKLAMNMILALQVDALAEALALTTRAGIQGEKLVEVLQSSMARSGVLDVKAPNLLKGEYVPSFPLRLMHKDLGLALDLANQLGVALPATAAARETYNYVKGAAKEDLDYSAVMKFWKR